MDICHNAIIALREGALNAIANPHGGALNLTDGSNGASIECDLTVDLRLRLQDILAAAYREDDRSVDYVALRASASYADYRTCAAQLNGFDPASLSRNERLAFWINLYNALVLDAVIALRVHKSVTEQLAGFKFFRQAAYRVGGQRVCCDDIEHGILRGNRGHPFLPGRQFRENDPRLKWVIECPDPRIHFALNCASRSCPPIRVFQAEQIESQLELAAKHFIASETYISPEKSSLTLSPIFKWFQADFGGREGALDFLLAHSPRDEKREWLRENRNTVRFKFAAYDWRLNSRSHD